MGIFFGSIIGLIWSSFYNRVVITQKMQNKKDAQEASILAVKRRLEAEGKSLVTFMNAMSMALGDWFYAQAEKKNRDVIDFDIIDCKSMTVSDENKDTYFVDVALSLRIVKCKKSDVKSRERNVQLKLKRNAAIREELQPGLNISKCPQCGSSLNLNTMRCEYCGAMIERHEMFTLERIVIA